MPSLIQRGVAAWRAVQGIFSDDSARQAFGLLEGMWSGGIGPPPTKGARERVAAYADMPWVYALADKVAASFAAVEWQVFALKPRGAPRAVRMKSVQRAGASVRRTVLGQMKQNGEARVYETHPLLDVLEGGNVLMTGVATRHVTSLHFDLEGEAFWLKERGASGLGVPTAVWPLPPDWIRTLPTPIDRNYRVGFRGWQGKIPETEIIWMPKHNPSNPYGRGTGIVRALADELETDEMAARNVRQTFFNQSRPDFVVSPKTPEIMNNPQLERLAQDWRQQHEGFWRVAKPRFASRELAIHEFQPTDFRRLQMTQLREFTTTLIRNVWGVPPEIMGIVEPGASRATIERANYIFARWVLVPRLEMFRALLQERLVPEYDDRLVIEYVSPVQEDKEFSLAVGQVAPWSRRADEWRVLGGLPPLENGEGQVFMVPFNLFPSESLGDVPALPAVSGPPPAADEARVWRRLARWIS